MHDGSVINLHKLNQSYDPRDRRSAVDAMFNAKERGDVLTGLIYIDPNTQELHEMIETTNKPLRNLTEKDLCPGSKALDTINESLR